MTDTSPVSGPSPRRTQSWRVGGAALAAIALVAVVAVNQSFGGPSNDATGDVTAWRLRVELEQVIHDTAAAVGLDIAVDELDSSVGTCNLPDGGGSGESYIVNSPTGPASENLDSALVQIRTSWEGKGWDVATLQIGTVKGLSATMTDGGSLYVLSGPGGTGFNGETTCARTGGGPSEPSNG